MTRAQEALLLTVARMFRANAANEIYAEQADDLRALDEVLAPFSGDARKWPRVFNVKRAENNAWHAEISFARSPTDEELSALEISLRDDHRPAPTIETA